MGLDSFDLNLDERFRPWRDAGLRFLLRGPDTDRFAVSRLGQAESVIRPYRPGPAGREPCMETQRKESAAAAVRKVRKPSTGKASQPAGQNREWPNPWDVYKTMLKTPCATVWTYWDLGLDMGGQPSSERRGLMGRIIGLAYDACKWRKGCVTFWPMTAIGSRGLTPNPDQFWKGVELTGASLVAVFGRRAHAALFPEREFEHGLFEYGERKIIVLPGTDEILDGVDDLKDQIISIFRQAGVP